MGIVNIIKTKAIVSEIKKQDWEKRGKESAETVDSILDDSCGDKKSAEIIKTIIPAANKFYLAFTKRLMELSQKGTKR